MAEWETDNRKGDMTTLFEELVKELPDMVPIDEAHPSGHGKLLVVRDGYILHHVPGRTAKARHYVFHDLGSFADWLNRHGDTAQTEICADETQVCAALNPIDPSGDLVSCQLRPHPAFVGWRDVFGKPLTQKAFHAHVRGNLASFERHPDGISAGEILARDLQTLNVVVVAGKDMSGELDERGYYRFQGATNKAAVGGSIPPRFNVRVPIFQGVQIPGTGPAGEDDGGYEACYTLELLLSLAVTDGGVAFTVSCPSLPVVMYQARLDAVAWLRSLLNEGFLVGLGTLTLRDVPDVEP